MEFALLQLEAERNATWLIAGLWNLVPSGDESSSCLDGAAHMNYGTKHDGVASLFSLFSISPTDDFCIRHG